MSDPQRYYHHSYQTSRNAGNRPQNVNAWLKSSEEMATPKEDRGCSNCRVPELEHSDAHVESEQVEGPLIAVADASLRPDAVMVQFVYAFPAAAAVRHSWYLYEVAFLTVFYLQTSVRHMLFVAEFLH